MLRSRTASLTEPASVIACRLAFRGFLRDRSRAVRSRSPITSHASARCLDSRRRVTGTLRSSRLSSGAASVGVAAAGFPPWSRCEPSLRGVAIGSSSSTVRGRAGELEGRIFPCPEAAPGARRRHARGGGGRRLPELLSRSTETSRKLASEWPTRLTERGAAHHDPVNVRIVDLPSRYIAGEESALVHWVNGGDAKPEFVPPRPFARGVRGRPTLIQNVETLAHLSLIARFGADWFRDIGTDTEPGSMLLHRRRCGREPGRLRDRDRHDRR